MDMEKCHTFYLYKLTLVSSLRSCGGSASRRGATCSTRAPWTPTARQLLLHCSTGTFTKSQEGLRWDTKCWGPLFISHLRSLCLRVCSTAVTPTLRPCRGSPSRRGLQPSCALEPTSNINSATQMWVCFSCVSYVGQLFVFPSMQNVHLIIKLSWIFKIDYLMIIFVNLF